MKIQMKFLSLMIVLIIVSEVAIYSTMKKVAEEIVADLIVRYSKLVSKYDTEKTLAPLIKELAIVNRLSNEPSIIRWSEKPDDEVFYQQAIDVLEHYRWTFSSNSYFVALKNNNGYYHNNKSNEFADSPLRYYLSPKKRKDNWFYHFIEQPEKVHININPDESLGLVRLWIDVQLRKGEEVFGVIGTGVDINSVMSDLVATDLDGIDTIFVDSDNVIQLYRQSGITREDLKKNNYYQKDEIGHYLDGKEDLEALKEMMESEQKGLQSKPIVIQYKGERHLATTSYIAELRWYEITLMNMDSILPTTHFVPMYVILSIVLLIVAMSVALAIDRWVIRPIRRLESRTQTIAKRTSSQVKIRFSKKPNDEMGLLMSHFEDMSKKVHTFTHELELKVAERTLALEKLASLDPLTELFNRRGMEREIKQEVSRARRGNYSFGLLWIDVDHFKRINDSLGHERGDEALKLIARQISKVIRDYDSACRWGGDEFLVLIRTEDKTRLEQLATRLRDRVRRIEISSKDQSISHLMSISIGGVVVTGSLSIEDALLQADNALYKAKSSGKNRVCMSNDSAAQLNERQSMDGQNTIEE